MDFKNDFYKEISDHVNKCHGVSMSTFKSSELGKRYTAKMDVKYILAPRVERN